MDQTTRPSKSSELAVAAAWGRLGSAYVGGLCERVVALARNHPYLAGAATVAAVAGAWAAHEAYVGGPAHRRLRQQEKRRARVRAASPFAVGFQNCPEVQGPFGLLSLLY
jgi:hypothetical protein